jgi:hypothetical protein
MSDEATRGPVQVELVIHDDTIKGGGFFSLLKGSIAIGLAGAGITGVLGSLAGRGLVTWQETPSSLATCRDAVQTAVDAALGNFLVVQLVAMAAGFGLLFFASFVKLRARQQARKAV